jgi:hypothetical protein
MDTSPNTQSLGRNPGCLLDRLEGVKSTGPDQWVAQCPAHEDQSPSLSIRDAGDRLLVHCFAGCSTEAVVAALGFQMARLLRSPEHSSIRTYADCANLGTPKGPQ